MNKPRLTILIMFVLFSSCASAPKAADYYRLGNIKYNKTDYNGAVFDYDNAIKLHPKYMQAYYARGLAKSKKGDYNGAISDMHSASVLGNQEADSQIRKIEKQSKLAPAIKAPKGLTAVPLQDGINLKWDKNTDTNSSYYSVYMSKDPLKYGYKIAYKKVHDNTLVVQGLKSGELYYFVVTSTSRMNKNIESAYSNEVSAIAK